MATQQVPAQHWADFEVATFAGQHDTKIDTGEDYARISLAQIFTMEPQAKPKMAGNAFLPSTYCDYDARSHDAQRQCGQFVALVGDIDTGDLSIEHVLDATTRFADGAAWLIYSSAHSRPGDRRWRIIIPLAAPIAFLDWFDAQMAFFSFMEDAGCAMDYALSRAGQPVYLPNVPEAYKDGTPLRDADGPLHYNTAANIDGPGLDITRGIVAGGIASIRRQRAADDKEREALRVAAAKRHAERKQGEGSNLIEQFNSSTSLSTMLEMCGYEQSPRCSDDWRSPQQTGETYATRIIEDKWVSLSATDAGSGLGQKCRAGCFGDAYDLYVHYKHNGDHKNAYRELGREQRGHNVVYGDFGSDDYANRPSAPDNADDYRDEDGDAEGVMTEQPPEAEEDLLPGMADPADWAGKSAPERRFLIPGWIVRGHAGLLSGMEGVGKSLIAQQLATCIAMGKEFLGLPVEQVNAVYLTCEDSLDELWRRQEAINKALGIRMEDLSGRLKMVSVVGELGNELGTFKVDGQLTPTKRYRQILKGCVDFNAGFIVLDNAAHLFAGNENARHDVAAFLGILERLSQIIDGAALLLAHPNKQLSQGNKQGNEYSGSTGWSAHVRNRLFLDYREDPEDGTPIDDDDRVLRKSKANYGKRGEEVYFRWHEWAFMRWDDMPNDRGREMELIAQTHAENERFLHCLDKATEERRAVSASPAASSYAPRVFAKMPAAKGMKKEAFEGAMNRLMSLGEIANDQRVYRRDNRTWAIGIARVEGCTNPRTNHAQSGAQSLHKPATNSRTQVHTARTPSTTYIGEPLEGFPMHGTDEPPEWMDEAPHDDEDAWRANPLLNPDFGKED